MINNLRDILLGVGVSIAVIASFSSCDLVRDDDQDNDKELLTLLALSQMASNSSSGCKVTVDGNPANVPKITITEKGDSQSVTTEEGVKWGDAEIAAAAVVVTAAAGDTITIEPMADINTYVYEGGCPVQHTMELPDSIRMSYNWPEDRVYIYVDVDGEYTAVVYDTGPDEHTAKLF